MYFGKVMDMNKIITVTSKGQTTLPIELRKKLGLPNSGGKLNLYYDDTKNELIISKTTPLEEISEKFSKHLGPDLKPLQNVDEYYQKNRRVIK